MKKYLIAFATIISLGSIAYGQNQIANLEGINYQAVAIDDESHQLVGYDAIGKPLYEREIGVRFAISNGPAGSVTYYQEEHSTTTDRYGMFSLTIGLGAYLGGDYSALLNIPWYNGDQWLMVEISTKNDGEYKEVSYSKFMAVPYSFYTDDIADNSITTWKIVDETIQAVDIDTSAVTTSEILDETILAEDIATGAVETSEILDETILAEDIATGAVETSEILDETILAEDIATGAVETSEILNETILAEDIATGAVETSEILNETILAEDIATGAVETSEILNETILAEDIATGAVETSEILNETILAEDIATGAVETSEILNETILAEDIATGAVETSEILNETILAEDIATGAVETSEILDGTILNQDIQNGTIDLTTKVNGILPTVNGGTGVNGSAAAKGTLLIGNGSGFTLDSLTAGTGIAIQNTPGGIEISTTITGGVNSNIAGNVNPNNILNGQTWISPAIPLQGVNFGNIIIGSLNTSLQGCQMTCFVNSSNIIKVSIYNGTGGNVNLGNGLQLRVVVVQ
jgi:hypothetical protein